MHTSFIIVALCSLGLSAAAQVPTSPAPAPGQSGVGAVDPALVDQFLAESAPGRLAVHAVQGTEGGPAIGAAEIEIDYYHNERLFRQATAALDGSGVVVLEDVPVALGVTPVVRLLHAGVTYVEVGPLMDAANPEAVITLTVYETTDEAPAWDIAMRHVMVEPSAEGARVGETLVVESPADRTWLGSPADAAGKRSTVRMRLPAGAREVHLTSGFHGWCCTTLENDEVAVQMPLMPGRTTFRYSYLVPPQGGEADVRVSAPAPMRSAVFFVPETGAAVRAVALEDAGPQQMGAADPVRMFQGQNLAAGQEAGIVLAGGIAQAAGGGGSGAAAHARLLGLIGAGVFAVVGIAVLAARAGAGRRAKTPHIAAGGS